MEKSWKLPFRNEDKAKVEKNNLAFVHKELVPWVSNAQFSENGTHLVLGFEKQSYLKMANIFLKKASIHMTILCA